MATRKIAINLIWFALFCACLPIKSLANEKNKSFEELDYLADVLAAQYEHSEISAHLDDEQSLYVVFTNFPVDGYSHEKRQKLAQGIANSAFKSIQKQHSISSVIVFFAKVERFLFITLEKDFTDNYTFHISDFRIEETLERLREALAQDPDSAQRKADLGWLYVKLGKLKEAFSLLFDAPIEPSYVSGLFFPIAENAEARRNLYLDVIDAINSELDGLRLTLGHIFIGHFAREKIFDEDLIAELQALAEVTRSPVVYDALSQVFWYKEDWRRELFYHEAALRRIKELDLSVQDTKHLSHFYYNAACGHSQIKDYEMAEKRLKEAFSIHRDLASWSLQDPSLQNLRNYLGIEQYKKVISPSLPPNRIIRR